MYCRTLNTMATDEYFHLRKEMGPKLGLSNIRKMPSLATNKWACEAGYYKKLHCTILI